MAAGERLALFNACWRGGVKKAVEVVLGGKGVDVNKIVAVEVRRRGSCA